MNIRNDSNLNSPSETKTGFPASKKSALHRQSGFFSTSLFLVNHQYRTRIEKLAGIDASESVANLIKRLEPNLSGIDAANKVNPGPDEKIASEFRELASHLYHAMKKLAQDVVARLDQKSLELDLAIDSADRKIKDYKVRAPEQLNTVFLKAEFKLRRASSNELSEERRFERFRYLNKLQHRDPRKVSRFSIMLISALAVLIIGVETVFGSEQLSELFIGNTLEGFMFVLAFVVANLIFGGVFVGRFGLRYLVHEKLAKKLFPGVFCMLLGIIGTFAITFYLCLLVAAIERLPSTTSDLGTSATALTAQHEADRQQAFINAKTHFVNLQGTEASSSKSLNIVLAILLSATMAYVGALHASDIYPGYSTADRALQSAQSKRRSGEVKGRKMITNEERKIVADLRNSLHATKSLATDVESAIVNMKVFVNDAADVTGAQTEGYRQCVSLYCRSTAVPHADRFAGSVVLTEPSILSDDGTSPAHEAKLDESCADRVRATANNQRAAADRFTSTLIAMRVESEENLREFNAMATEKSAAADTQLNRQSLTNEELDKLISEIKQCAAEYKSRLNLEQHEH